jgi:hypothetical protein
MLKCLAILAITTILAVSVPGQPNKGSTKNEDARTTSPQSEGNSSDQDSQKTPSVIVQVGAQQPNPSEGDEEKETQRTLAVYTLWLAILTGVFVGVSGIQGYFLFKQAGHLHVHAGHLDNLAEASTTTSKAMAEMSGAISEQAEIMGKP